MMSQNCCATLDDKASKKLSPFYKKALERLLQNVKEAPNYQIQEKLFESFYQKYTMISDLGMYWKNLQKIFYQGIYTSVVTTKEKALTRKLLKHFYMEEEAKWRFYAGKPDLFPFLKTMTVPYLRTLQSNFETRCAEGYKNLQKYLDDLLKFPHSKLEYALKLYMKYGAFAPSNKIIEQYKKSQSLYKKIVDAESDDTKWLQCLMEVNDEEFIIQNLELRLGQNPCNKVLWKLYFDFLIKNNNKAVLNVYQRYCRFFIEDEEIRNQYKTEIYRFNKLKYDVSKWFIDIIKFEFQFGGNSSIEKGLELLHEALNTITIKSKALFKFAIKIGKKYENFQEISEIIEKNRSRLAFSKWHKIHETSMKNVELYSIQTEINNFILNVSNQNFSLPKTLMSYINSKSNFNIYNKLIQSCKYFVIKQKAMLIWDMQVCYSIGYTNFMDFVGNSLYSIANESMINEFKKLWIGKKLKIKSHAPMQKIYSQISQKIYKQSIKEIDLSVQMFTIEEFEIISGSKKLEVVILGAVFILNHENGEETLLEKIFEKLVNVRNFEWFNPNNKHHSIETIQKMASFERTSKLDTFHIYFNEMFDPIYFCEFLNKNASPTCDWVININNSPDLEYQSRVKSIMDPAILNLNVENENARIHYEFTEDFF